MVDQYLDIEKKFIYHKESILNQFIQKGIYPNNALISSQLDNIDLNLSIFKNYNKTLGENFNVDEYNLSIQMIYADIKILYKILEEFAIKEYNDLQNYINSYINELSSIVDTYKNRANYENNSTTLGETLLFQNNKFTVSNDNSTTIINLESIELEDASEIACIANINNIDKNNIIFTFTKGDTELTVSPYNISNSTLTIPGEKTITSYDYSLSETQQVNGPTVLNLNTEVLSTNKYSILSGKNKMFINNKSTNAYSVQDIPNNAGALLFNEKLYINFYVVGGNTISFKFNKDPISTNFPIYNNTVTNLSNVHHFFLECDEGFCFEIELDKGEIYAIKEDGIVNNNKIYYTGPNIVKDFHVIEESTGLINTYDVKLKIYNDNNNDIDIENIVIKKIN